MKRLILAGALLLSACAGNPEPNPLLPGSGHPILLQGAPYSTEIDGRVSGRLELAGRCLRLRTAGGQAYLLVWPTGTSLTRNASGAWEVFVTADYPSFEVGDRLEVSGASITRRRLVELVGGDSECPGQVWIVSSLARPVSR